MYVHVKKFILVVRKLFNLSFLLFKKIFFVKNCYLLKKKGKLNNRFFK